MKRNYASLIFGLLLILAGGFAFAVQNGYLENLAAQTWALIFGGVSLAFFAAYFLSGIRAWGWLFPACIFGGVSATIYLAEAGFQSAAIGAPILASVGIPFVVAFALDTRKNWWALIPAFTMGALTVFMFFVDRMAGEWAVALLFSGFSIPFVIAFLADRKRWWALIVAFVFVVIGAIPALANNLPGQYIGAFINIVIGLPFLAAYFFSRRAWWGIIPGGVLVSIGVMIALTGMMSLTIDTGTLAVSVMFLGWAGTFALVWRRRELHPAAWAKYPTLVLAGLAVIMFLVSLGFTTYWSLLLIAGGIFLMYLSLRPKTTTVK
jgi:hypothetical protein